MEQAIRELDQHTTDEPAKHMLQGLVEKKRKFDTLKKKCLQGQLFTFGFAICFMIYFYYFILQPNTVDFTVILSRFVQDPFHLFFVVGIAAGYATCVYYKKKEEKAEAEYHQLRCEVIKKSQELWPQPYFWKKRHEVYTMMKSEFGINLFFESK
ncbi:DUF2663 family protein [Bacillus lacus]|uniref:DUF2663 family protein n=1 Tax=Metabacillus lacus TaxID=1983721 RepID=A0A7X2LX87_9BACI|nr:DUF2663 family protein [Metabacillus lacus]MRX71031.1 DUF2663 family protein [Metabacillus lacus]